MPQDSDRDIHHALYTVENVLAAVAPLDPDEQEKRKVEQPLVTNGLEDIDPGVGSCVGFG